MKENPCTLGFDDKSVMENGGLLNFLSKHKVSKLLRIKYTVNQQTQLPSKPIEVTKFGKIRHMSSTVYDISTNNPLNLQELLQHLSAHGIQTDRMPRELAFVCPISGHTFSVLKKGKWTARVDSIDGICIYNSFSESQINKIFYGSIFAEMGGVICEVERSRKIFPVFTCKIKKPQ